MRIVSILLITFFLLPQNNVKAEKFRGLVNVNPINNYLKDFLESYNRVLAATNYIDKADDDYEDAVFYLLAEIELDDCFTTRSRYKRKECIEKLEFVGESLEAYLGL